jgi:N-acyl-phosphatidylethanolamine-hydrolysing phospholipase D
VKNPHYDATRRHHRPDGFQNTYLPFERKGLRELLRWRWQAWRQQLPRPPQQPIAVVAPDLGFIAANAAAGLAMQPAVTWIGHITTLVQFGGWNLLTDPVFSERCSPVQWAGPRRHTPPGLALEALPRIDVVLLSHNHYDHMDEASLRALARQPGGAPQVIAPLGHRTLLRRWGLHDVVELDWWQHHTLAADARHTSAEITLTPAQHWSSRGWNDAMRSLWGSFVVLSPDCHFFFSGDTGYSQDFRDIRRHFAHHQAGGGFDLALLPIGAYEPRWFMRGQHANPDEAVQMFEDLHVQRAVAVHWGTFQLTDESLDEPPRALARALHRHGIAPERFRALAIGETMTVPRRGDHSVPPTR